MILLATRGINLHNRLVYWCVRCSGKKIALSEGSSAHQSFDSGKVIESGNLWYPDVNNLRRSDIKCDHIEVTTVKTVDSLSIELNKVTNAMKPYVDIADSIKARSMTKFDGLI